jgi:hypothetical protein
MMDRMGLRGRPYLLSSKRGTVLGSLEFSLQVVVLLVRLLQLLGVMSAIQTPAKHIKHTSEPHPPPDVRGQ